MRLVMPGFVGDIRSMPFVRLLVIVTAMGLYLSMGASVFQALEGPVEQEMEEHMEKVKMDFLNDHPCLSVKPMLCNVRVTMALAKVPKYREHRMTNSKYGIFKYSVNISKLFLPIAALYDISNS
ncbi:unnamed protein product [Euphydryas editha]|uniref:Uncharacterized protein n=1 Tax=Euphydryas editha TaxID=104508 RepID=A0AAU9TCW3_EUPED|nr:unnamed protein product [Euphydryas editha]